MVNNAGVFGGSNLIDAPNEEVDRMVGVNILGAFYGTRAAGRVMAAQVRAPS